MPYSAMSWTLRDVWTENRTPTTAEKVEENERYIKLAFPVKESQTWNGNAQNTQEEWMYEYAFFDQIRYIGPQKFDSVLQVTQHDEENLIVKKYYEEKYARNAGLVYKRVIDIESQPPSFTGTYASDSLQAFYQKPIMTRVTSGINYTYTFNSVGVE
jgi:hypothetical protein